MDASLNTILSVSALAASSVALFFSLVAAFPGLKSVVAAVRDGVLWFALFLVLGASGFIVWQHLQLRRGSSQTARGAVVASERH